MRRVFKSKRGAPSLPKSSNNANSIQAIMSGSKFVPSDDPPVLSGQPWNTIILDTSIAIPAGTWSSFNGNELFLALKNQAGFNGVEKVKFEVRIQALSVWAAETSNDKTIHYARLCVMPLDFLTGSGNVELTRLESNSMKNKFAKTGYKYPIHISSVPVFLYEGLGTKLFSFQASATCDGIVHYKILWRGADAGFKAGISIQKYIPYRNLPREDEDVESITSSLEKLDLTSQKLV